MIVTLSDRPDLAPRVAAWLVGEFGYEGGRTVEQVALSLLAPAEGPEETFVLFDQDTPVATASLTRTDLKSRPDLTPWLAGVFVEPAFRGRGHATTLVQRVEAFARAVGVTRFWLYTWTAESLYARLGWQRVGLEQDRGQAVVLMIRHLSGDLGQPMVDGTG